MKEAFPYKADRLADYCENESKLIDMETGEPKDVDTAKLMSRITKTILNTYENYICNRPSSKLSEEFDDTITYEVKMQSIEADEEPVLRDVLLKVRTPIAKAAGTSAEVSDNSVAGESETSDDTPTLDALPE